MENSPTYIFPEKVAAKMATMSPKVQYEASMMGTTLMGIGLIVTAIYFIFFFDFAWWYNGIIILNVIAGVLVMSASVTTTYQQYLAYMQALELQKSLAGEATRPDIVLTPKSIKTIRYIIGAIAAASGSFIAYKGITLEWDTLWQVSINSFLLGLGSTILLWGAYKVLTTNSFIKNKFADNMKGGTENG